MAGRWTAIEQGSPNRAGEVSPPAAREGAPAMRGGERARLEGGVPSELLEDALRGAGTGLAEVVGTRGGNAAEQEYTRPADQGPRRNGRPAWAASRCYAAPALSRSRPPAT